MMMNDDDAIIEQVPRKIFSVTTATTPAGPDVTVGIPPITAALLSAAA